jgi:dihydrofolate reductase
MENRKLVLYTCMSVDGYLATNDDDLSWLSIVEKEGEDYTEFISNVDSYIVGRKTYEKVLEMTGGNFPQAEMFDCYVLTRAERENENGVTFYNGGVTELVTKLKTKKGKNIYCDGGAEVVKLLMDKNLIDEYLITVIPTFLGEGKRLFKGGIARISLKPMPSKYFDKGVTQLHYLVNS